MESREFPTAVIASISSGVLLCDFSAMQEAAQYLMGHQIWTHHFASKDLWRDMQRTILDQCPRMPTDIVGVNRDNYHAKLAEIEAVVGKVVRIRKGSGLTALLPEDGLPDHLKDGIIEIAT